MSTVVVLAFALGTFLVYDAWTGPQREPAHRVARWSARLEAWLSAAGLASVGVAQFVITCAASGLVAALLVAALLGSPVMAVLALLAGSYVPVAFFRARRRARRRSFLASWPEAIELLAGAVRSGDTLPAAIAVVAERGPEPLRPTFRSLVVDHRVSGSLGGALERLADAVADPTADRIAITLRIAAKVGGRELGRVLRTLAAFLREDLAVRKEIEARQSWTVVAARVAAGAPWLVLLPVATRADALSAYDSVAGLLVLIGGAAATIAGYRLMMAVGRLPEEPRVLAGNRAPRAAPRSGHLSRVS